MAEQKEVTEKGGTMRLGQYDCHLTEGSLAREVYGADEVQERHRHRYEVNNHLRYKLREHGMCFTGTNPERDLIEIVELPQEGPEGVAHPWFVGVQFHPEYKSTVQNPHPLFVAFVGAAVAHAKAAGTLETPRPPTSTRKVRRASAKVLRSGDGEAGTPAGVKAE
jgi:CTP synthase